MDFLNAWRQRAAIVARCRDARRLASERVGNSLVGGLTATASVAGEAYTAALDWKNNSELSNWLTDRLSNQHATLVSKGMDSEYIRTHIGGGWHRLYDGGHSLAGSWNVVGSSLPDLSPLGQLDGQRNIGKT
jgi:hypothetical protein